MEVWLGEHRADEPSNTCQHIGYEILQGRADSGSQPPKNIHSIEGSAKILLHEIIRCSCHQLRGASDEKGFPEDAEENIGVHGLAQVRTHHPQEEHDSLHRL